MGIERLHDMTTIMVSVAARKVLIHKLPPLLTSDEFLAQLPSPWSAVSPEEFDSRKSAQRGVNTQQMATTRDTSNQHFFRLLLYVEGCISRERGIVDYSRAYVILPSAISVKWFGDTVHGMRFEALNKAPESGSLVKGKSAMMHGYERLHATHAFVEVAPCPQLPKKVNNAKLGKTKGRRRGKRYRKARDELIVKEVPLETNTDYQNFLNQQAGKTAMDKRGDKQNNGDDTGENADGSSHSEQKRHASNATWSNAVSARPKNSVTPKPELRASVVPAAPATKSHLVATLLAQHAKEQRILAIKQNKLRRSKLRENKRSSGKRTRPGRKGKNLEKDKATKIRSKTTRKEKDRSRGRLNSSSSSRSKVKRKPGADGKKSRGKSRQSSGSKGEEKKKRKNPKKSRAKNVPVDGDGWTTVMGKGGGSTPKQ